MRLLKNRETNGGQQELHWFHEFYLDVSSLVVTTSAFEKKGKVKDEISKKIVKTNGGQIKEQDVQLTYLRFPTIEKNVSEKQEYEWKNSSSKRKSAHCQFEKR